MSKDKHHRIPRSRGGNHKSPQGRPNIIKVDATQHARYHQLFGNMLAHEIATYLNHWIDADLMFVVVPRRK